MSSRPPWVTLDWFGLKEKQSQLVVAHTFNLSIRKSQAFNPNIREVETGRNMAGQREEYKVGGDRSSRIQSKDL